MPLARNVWAMMKDKVEKCSNEVHDFFHLFLYLGDNLTKRELEQWTALSWALWNVRNKVYFEKVQAQPKTIVEGALLLLETYQQFVVSQTNV